jgi:hypothetical protein
MVNSTKNSPEKNKRPVCQTFEKLPPIKLKLVKTEGIKKAAPQQRKCSVSFQMASLPFAGITQIRFKGSSG